MELEVIDDLIPHERRFDHRVVVSPSLRLDDSPNELEAVISDAQVQQELVVFALASM